MTDEAALRLHDRAARGGPLTDEEGAQLDAWYAAQDLAEARELAANAAEPAGLTEKIHASLDQVAEAARKIQKTVAENDSLRHEISGLRFELAQQTAHSG